MEELQEKSLQREVRKFDISAAQTPFGSLDPEVQLAIKCAQEKKGIDIKGLDLREIATFTEHFIIATGSNQRQVQAIADLKPNAYTGTPSFLRILIHKCREAGVALSLRKAFVSGEAFPPALQREVAEAGIDAYQGYATADLGLVAYETEAREGLVLDEDVIVEIVRPGGSEPVPEGEVGEVVVTTFNPVYPLIRFGTGDLSAVLPGISPCGRTNTRIRGWLGRADQTTKVKGMFVHPSQVLAVASRHPEVRRARLVVENPNLSDVMILECEVAQGDNDLRQAIETSLREITKLRGEVRFVPPGSLPNDGKVIDDRRKYD